ncbi:MAG: hypothetical protein FJW56_00320 [Actinobacteria bacterium]|nr:hypothetical protein [Actinomycetota bacterium]
MANGCTKHTTVITHINGTITQYWASMVTCPNARMTNPNQSFSELIIESGKIKMSKGNFDDEEMKLFELMQNFDKENIVGKKLTKFEMDALIKKREKIVSSFYGDKIISYSAKPPRDCDGCNINKEIESLKNELKKKIH